jgi:hypothetical protein
MGQPICKRCSSGQQNESHFNNPITAVQNIVKSIPKSWKIAAVTASLIVLTMIVVLVVYLISATSNKDWGNRAIPGTNYTIGISTRFYYYKMLYVLRVEPYDEKAYDFSQNISLELVDKNSHTFSRIESDRGWLRSVDFNNNSIGLERKGSKFMTLKNYLEISGWEPIWRE